jgi:hypothetical protein
MWDYLCGLPADWVAMQKSQAGLEGTAEMRLRESGVASQQLPIELHRKCALGVPGHHVGYRRLIGGLPPSALWRRTVL